MSTPSLGGNGADILYAVSCTSATACTAAGNASQVPFTESWGGTSWTIGSNPQVGDGEGDFDGVSCISPAVCTAVGNYQTGTATMTLAEQSS
jgi:hypothetical protein